ncbi:nucleotide-diphospho-sugar transferase [Aspergillus oleicola]
MISRLLLVILLPLALTSPHVAPFAATALFYGRALLIFVMGMCRKHCRDYVAAITYWTSKHSYWASRQLGLKKPHSQTRWIKTFRKSSQGRKIDKYLTLLLDLYGLIPRDIQILLSRAADTLLSLLPSNTRILLNKFFANRAGTFFFYLFIFRYSRLIVHIISFWLFYRPTPVPKNPSYHPRDCTVIFPAVDPQNPDFNECLTSCLMNEPGVVIIITVGSAMTELTKRIVAPFQRRFPYTRIRVKASNVANKRIQIATGLQYVDTKITILLDDRVFWPSPRFLPTILAPFEDPNVGIVGTNKRVRRTESGFNMRSFWNMLGALYLERHNFEIRATNAIDGGVFVVSGRTSAHRSTILTDPSFIRSFTNEKFCLGLFGPLNADDDNFITRWHVKQGHKIKIQYSRDACIETTLGTYPKFLSQCLRWARTTWRNNSASMFTNRTVWYRQPWCVYAVYISSFVNFALFYDAALILTLRESEGAKVEPNALSYLLRWIFVSKMVKLTSYFLREPQDLIMLPGYFAFAYFHSLIKLYALLTFWVTSLGGRDLDALKGNGASSGPGSRAKSSPKVTASPTPAPAASSRAMPRTTPKTPPAPKAISRPAASLTPTPIRTQLQTPAAPVKPKARNTRPELAKCLDDPEWAEPDDDEDDDPSYNRKMPARASPAKRGRGRPRESPTPILSIVTDPASTIPGSSPGITGVVRRGRPRKVA